MFLEFGRVDSKLNRESGRIYNISGMPGGSCLIYSRCNRFPGFSIRRDGDSVRQAAGQLDSRAPSAGPCKFIKAYSNRIRTDVSGHGYGVQAVDRTPQTPGFLSRSEPMHAGMHPNAADYFAAERKIRFGAVIDCEEE
jgi:hypothetical protein